MLDKETLDSLLQCHSEEKIYSLLGNEIFPFSDSSKFTDDILRFKTSSGEFTNVHIRLKGISNLAFKTVLLLKLHGYIGMVPTNSGVRAYATTLSKIIRDLCYGIENRLDEVIFSQFNDYVENRAKEVLPATAKEDIMKIYDWITFANPLLPYILRLDERLSNKSNIVEEVFKKSRKDNQEYQKGVGGTKNRLLPLNETKIIMKKAINYMESYSEEILLCIPTYLDRKKAINDYQERKHIVEYFKAVKFTFREPLLKQLQQDAIMLKSNEVKGPSKKLLHAIKTLEAACIFIALSLTGYRAYEFVKLPRFPKFRQEEHEFLTRLVTKTSLDAEGEEVEMPIPVAAKTAIQIISKLTAALDGKKNGDLLRSSWENLTVQNVISPSQRLSLAINYFCKVYRFNPPTPHMTRHTMAFIISYLSEGDSLELARLFLGHKSISMTLRYLGHYNSIYKESIEEVEYSETEFYAKQISDEIRYGNKLYGKSGERIMEAQFTGIYVEEFADLLEVGLIEMVKLSQYVILSTPYCYCIHDKSTTNNMPCQQGFNIFNQKDSLETLPLTGKCKPGACNNAVFTGQHISQIQANQLSDSVPIEFKERISENIYFIKDGGLEELDLPLQRILKQYTDDKVLNTKEGA